ncbi:MAG TPA: hypothetical protein VGA48_06400 [Thermoplasmata archaeon]
MKKRLWGEWVILAFHLGVAIPLTALSALIVSGLPRDVTLSFFGGAMQVNAALLIAAFVAAAAVVPRLPDSARRRHYSLLFSADVVIFFNGLLIST